MGIGAGIFLVAVGAVLTFAVHAKVSGIDLSVVGWILMAAGVVGVALDLAVFAPRRRRSTTTSEYASDPVTGRAVQRTETRDDGTY